MTDLAKTIESLYEMPVEHISGPAVSDALERLRSALNNGEVRAAEMRDGNWRVNAWVKKGILLAFRTGVLRESGGNGTRFFDKDTMPVKTVSIDDGIRIVPGGSAIRDGTFVARGVVLMPPSYINVGAYVGEGTMIDSHVLIGSCAQIGRRVHLSAGAQIGGVLEPVGSMPVIVEDDVFIGGNCGIYEGTMIKCRGVIAAGVILTGGTPVFDLVNEKVYRKAQDEPLVIPEGAVVVAGNRRIQQRFAKDNHISIYTPIIVKYRDAKTDISTVLEDSLR